MEPEFLQCIWDLGTKSKSYAKVVIPLLRLMIIDQIKDGLLFIDFAFRSR